MVCRELCVVLINEFLKKHSKKIALCCVVVGGSLTVQIMGARSDSDSEDTGRLNLDKKSKISSNDPSVIVKSGNNKQR